MRPVKTDLQRATPADVLNPAALIILLYAGSVKESPVFAWMPIDLTFVAMALVTVLTTFQVLRHGLPAGAGLLGILVLAFAIPILWTSTSEYSERKILFLFTITLPSALAAAVMVSNQWRVIWLLRWFVLGSLGISLLIQIAPSSDELYGRLALEGSNSIAVGRAAGAGLVALGLLVLVRRVPKLIVFAVAPILVAIMFGSGSRGPLLAVGIAALVVAATRPGMRKVKTTAVALAALGFAFWYGLGQANETAAERIMLLFSDQRGASVEERVLLFSRAFSSVVTRPIGLGWGDLAPELFPVGRYPHNILLEVFGEAGWLPGIIFVGVVAVAFGRALRLRWETPGVAVLGLLAFWLVNALVSGDVNDSRAFFACLGIGLSLRLKSVERLGHARRQSSGLSIPSSRPA